MSLAFLKEASKGVFAFEQISEEWKCLPVNVFCFFSCFLFTIKIFSEWYLDNLDHNCVLNSKNISFLFLALFADFTFLFSLLLQ